MLSCNNSLFLFQISIKKIKKQNYTVVNYINLVQLILIKGVAQIQTTKTFLLLNYSILINYILNILSKNSKKNQANIIRHKFCTTALSLIKEHNESCDKPYYFRCNSHQQILPQKIEITFIVALPAFAEWQIIIEHVTQSQKKYYKSRHGKRYMDKPTIPVFRVSLLLNT